MDSSNPYQAPQAEIAPQVEQGEALFYVVSSRKFWILFVATSGFYGLYWFYKQWATYKAKTGEGMWPVMRAWFNIFFTHNLFGQFESGARAAGAKDVASLTGFATLCVVLSITENATGRLSAKSIGSPYTDLVQLLVSPIIGFCLWKAQLVANVACGDPEGEQNSNLTAANWVWIVIGALFWLMVFLGLAMMFGWVEGE
ncbi:hypothetical protein [Roseibacillus persicicus]|uniref:DUF4234 domain-containing protein n=1 Tax=Roseibacillus persicicus TaxID=454148 RepID=A0A918U005_9BACT|nr:hypothetical protein [Roseibacillus persicicus]GHC64369.1 hypothetical protein GCM10007100_35110 [Roseibacillus persicicus]